MTKKILMAVVFSLFFTITSALPIVVWADTDSLSKQQGGVANRYQRLEELLLRLADVEAAENPERSALLRRAARQSRDKFVLDRMQAASKAIQNQEFQKAVENQDGAKEELASLLKLLMSEDRSKRIRDEKQRYTKLIKDLKRNLNNQRSARARTENGADLKRVQKEQKDVTDRSRQLNKRLREDNQDDKPIESPKEKEHRESPQNKHQGEKAKPKGQKEAGEMKPKESGESEAKPSPSSKKQPGKPSSGKSQQGKKQAQSQPSKKHQTPATPEQEVQKQLEQAVEKMKQAEEELQKADREKATGRQRQAEEKLRAAIDRLERILRQLREEEMQRDLAKLESRLRKMAAMQTEVFGKTKTLAATPKAQRDRATDLKAGDLSFREKKITLEADRAMLLLREEGSSVAFPEVVASIRADTTRVADRLAKSRIDAVTQGIESDILAALEEMIAALQKAQRDLEKQRQKGQQGKPGQSGQGEQPLVEALAELKLLRTMERRIKSTTDRYSGLLESGESLSDEVLPLLQDLSQRQNRLYQITRDLVLKRNQ